MTITEALKAGKIDRIVNGNTWLVWDLYVFKFMVYHHEKYGRLPHVLLETDNEEEAVAMLIRN